MRHVVALTLLAALTLSACAECKLPAPQTGPLPACVLEAKTLDCAKSSGIWTTQEAMSAAATIFQILLSVAEGTAWQTALQTWATTSQLPQALSFVLCEAPAVEAYVNALVAGEKGAPPILTTTSGFKLPVPTSPAITKQVHDRVAWIRATWGPNVNVVNFNTVPVVVR